MADIKKRWARVQFGGKTDEDYDVDEFLKFESVEPKLSKRADLHAFMRLDQWFPDEHDIISGANHDEIYLNIDEEQLESLTDEQILELLRCGVFFVEEYGCLMMFV